jgi:hypothetical protein
MPVIKSVTPEFCAVHVLPRSVVFSITPNVPAAKQMPMVGQVTANRGAPLGDGLCHCQVPELLGVVGATVRGAPWIVRGGPDVAAAEAGMAAIAIAAAATAQQMVNAPTLIGLPQTTSAMPA